MNEVTQKSDSEVLSPQPVAHKMGNRVFEQMPMTLDSMGNMTSLLFEVISLAAGSDALDAFRDIDLTTDVGRAQALPAFMRLLNLAPVVLPRLVAAMLNVKDEEDVEFIRLNCRPGTLMKIMSTFIDQNEPEELFDAFLTLKTQAMRMVTAIQKS